MLFSIFTACSTYLMVIIKILLNYYGIIVKRTLYEIKKSFVHSLIIPQTYLFGEFRLHVLPLPVIPLCTRETFSLKLDSIWEYVDKARSTYYIC